MSQRLVSYEYEGKMLKVELVPTDSVRPHEMIINELEESITNSLKIEGIMKDPIIADPELGLIIDGTHRWKALKNLDIDYIPIIPMNYYSKEIKLYRWIRIYDEVPSPTHNKLIETLTNTFKEINYIGNMPRIPINHIEPIYLMYRNDGEWICHKYNKHLNIITLLDTLGRFEDIISRVVGQTPNYIAENNVKRFVERVGDGVLILSYRRIEKDEVVEIFRRKLYMPPKTTRHVTPYRIIGINIPINHLIYNNLDKALKFLSNLKIEYLGRGIYIGDRFYEEDVYRAIHKD